MNISGYQGKLGKVPYSYGKGGEIIVVLGT